jgi:hypothetical protein
MDEIQQIITRDGYNTVFYPARFRSQVPEICGGFVVEIYSVSVCKKNFDLRNWINVYIILIVCRLFRNITDMRYSNLLMVQHCSDQKRQSSHKKTDQWHPQWLLQWYWIYLIIRLLNFFILLLLDCNVSCLLLVI